MWDVSTADCAVSDFQARTGSYQDSGHVQKCCGVMQNDVIFHHMMKTFCAHKWAADQNIPISDTLWSPCIEDFNCISALSFHWQISNGHQWCHNFYGIFLSRVKQYIWHMCKLHMPLCSVPFWLESENETGSEYPFFFLLGLFTFHASYFGVLYEILLTCIYSLRYPTSDMRPIYGLE